MSHGSAAGGVAIPALKGVLTYKLRHETSATTTQLAFIREALCYVKPQSPQPLTLFCDSKSALQILVTVMQRSRYQQLALGTLFTLSGLLQSAHQIAFQWISSPILRQM